MAGTRLIIYEPPGSPNCPPELVDGCWNTGLLEGCADPQQFANRVALENYAMSRGESIRQVSTAAEGLALCRAWSSVTPPPLPQHNLPSLTPPPIGAATGSGTHTSVLYAPSPGAVQQPGSPEPINEPSSGASILPGDTSTGRSFQMGEIYRLIIVSEPGRVDTGGTYPGCSRSNPDACKPMQFASVEDAVAYAQANNETPYMVNTIDEAWNIVEGRQGINPAQVISAGMPSSMGIAGIAAAVAAVFFLPKLFKKRSA